ncbi:MAG: decaprenyl-phosphate phosphoribosyltransferase [Ignavibacteria bacterium]
MAEPEIKFKDGSSLTADPARTILNYMKMMRIEQWIKNLFVFVPLIFSRHLFDMPFLFQVIEGFIAFCLTSGAVYIMNDLIDIKSDMLHPVKRFRPIASGAVSKGKAVTSLVILVLGVLLLMSQLNIKFNLVLLSYVAINICYSFYLKHIVIVDIMSIAAGFMLRVLAGGFVISVYISSWLILTTLFVSLFLAVMKRRSELSLTLSEEGGITRKVLSEYTISFTDQIATISASGVIICYALYSVSERTVNYLHTESLVYTTVFVVFGIFRFMYLVYRKSKGENATEVMMTDLPMIINTILYVLAAVYIVYFK